MKKDLLKLLDLSREEIIEILDMADQMKYSQKHGIAHDHLKGKTLAMIFEKNSTRTRVSFAKGVAGGLPMGGFLVNEKCRRVFGPVDHASTFGGNPIAAAAACAVLDILDDGAIRQVAEKGEYLRHGIEALDVPCLGGTRGLGLMIGIEVRDGYTNKELYARLNEAGLLCLTAGEVLRLLPPLTITKDEMDKGLSIMKAELS